MPKLNQRGVIHLIVLLILIIGMIGTIYLVTKGPLNIFSKASLSKPIGPETSFTLVGPGPQDCTAGFLCSLGFIPQPQLQEEFSVQVYARSDIETANLFEAKMYFPKDLVEVKEIQTKSDFIKNWVETYYDNSTGEISLVGGVPDPGYQTQTGGQSGLMAAIVFKAKKIGKGPISFKDSSAIYSNLNSINILTIKRPYEISVEVKPSPPPVSGPITTVSILGSCVIKDDATSLPKYNAADAGPGYVKFNIGAVKDLAEAKVKCDDILFKRVMNNYCSSNIDVKQTVRQPAQWSVATYDGYSYNYLSSTCAASGCGKQSCPITTVPSGTGDGNKDGKINLVDLSILLADFNKNSGIRTNIDMNGDGKVNVFDFSLLKNLLIQNGVIKP